MPTPTTTPLRSDSHHPPAADPPLVLPQTNEDIAPLIRQLHEVVSTLVETVQTQAQRILDMENRAVASSVVVNREREMKEDALSCITTSILSATNNWTTIRSQLQMGFDGLVQSLHAQHQQDILTVRQEFTTMIEGLIPSMVDWVTKNSSATLPTYSSTATLSLTTTPIHVDKPGDRATPITETTPPATSRNDDMEENYDLYHPLTSGYTDESSSDTDDDERAQSTLGTELPGED